MCHGQSDYVDVDDYHDDDADQDDDDDNDDDEDFNSNYCRPMFPWLVERANLMFTFITTLLSRQSVDFHFNGRSGGYGSFPNSEIVISDDARN